MRIFILLAKGIRYKRRSFTVLRHCSFALSSLIYAGQYFLDFRLNVNDYTISDTYSMMKLIWHPMTGLLDRCTDRFKVFSRFLAMAEVHCLR